MGCLRGGGHRKALASMTTSFRSSAHTAYQLIFSANGCALSVLSDSTSSTCSDRGVTLGPSSSRWMVDRADRLAEGAGDSAGAASNVSSSSRCFALRFERSPSSWASEGHRRGQSMLDISVHVVSRYIQQRRWALDAPGDRRGRMQSPRTGAPRS